MTNFLAYKVLLWDFDGVIMDSMPVRYTGFQEVLKNYPKDKVDQLLSYHSENGGLSRYAKFRYFYQEILMESYTEEQINSLADQFSEIMLSLLLNKALLIKDSCSFIFNFSEKYDMHIVSGSDGKELNIICEQLGISKYFKTINGSPTPKINLVHDLLKINNYSSNDVCLIGDSHNDFEAATANGISFFGYNNPKLKEISSNYIFNFSGVFEANF